MDLPLAGLPVASELCTLCRGLLTPENHVRGSPVCASCELHPYLPIWLESSVTEPPDLDGGRS